MNSVKDFRGKIEPPVERGVLKIERYVQRLTQGYSAHGGSYLWAPVSAYHVSSNLDQIGTRKYGTAIFPLKDYSVDFQSDATNFYLVNLRLYCRNFHLPE